MTAQIGTKTVGRIHKILFKDRFENLLYRHLDDLVLDSRDSEWSFIAVWLWDIDTLDRFWFVLFCFKPCYQIGYILI